MKPEEHFEEFFICPNCRKPIVRKNAIKYYEGKFCGKCGIRIVTAIEEAKTIASKIENQR